MRHWTEVEGWWSDGDRNEYARLMEMLPDGAFMTEIGTFKGRSLASVADVIKKKRIKVNAVDIFGTVPTPDKDVQAKSKDMIDYFSKTISDFDLKDFVNTYIGLSSNAAAIANHAGGFFNMVFIDGDHSYEAVKEDLLAWWPLILKGGIISGHDYGSGWTGVKRAVDEFFNTKYQIHLCGELWSVIKGDVE